MCIKTAQSISKEHEDIITAEMGFNKHTILTDETLGFLNYTIKRIIELNGTEME